MSELTPLVKTLRNLGTGAGEAPTSSAIGDASAGRTYVPSMIAEKPDNTLTLLKATSSGELIVNQDSAAIANLSATGKLVGTNVEAVVAEITLTNDLVYKELDLAISCFRDALFRVEQIDDEGVGDVITELVSELRVGNADHTKYISLKGLEFTAGSTGVVKLRVVGYNLGATSDMTATLSIKEEQE